MASVVTKVIKDVADGRSGLTVAQSDLPGAQAGDVILAVPWTLVSTTQLTTNKDWQALRATSTGPPTLATLGSAFDDVVDLAWFPRRGTVAATFMLARDWASADFPLTFTAINGKTGGGGALVVLLLVVRGVADNPLAAMPPVAYSTSQGDTLPLPARTGLVPDTPALRMTWGASLLASAAETIEWGGGTARWSDVSGVTIAGGAVGVRRGGQYAIGAFVADTDNVGDAAAMSAVFSPTQFAAATSLFFQIADAKPANLFGQPPGVTGTAQGSQILTSTLGTWVGDPTITYARQWQQSSDGGITWADISGQTASTLSVTEGMVGKKLRVRVTGTNGSGSSQAFSAATASVITGLVPSPSGRPVLSGNVHTGLAIVNEILTFGSGTLSWTLSPTLVTEWGRSNTADLANVSVVGTGASRAVVNADVEKWLTVRQRDTTTGVASQWAAPVIATAAWSALTDLTYCSSSPTTDGLVPGALLTPSAPFLPLYTTYGNYTDYAVIFLRNDHAHLAVDFDVVLDDNTADAHTDVQFAAVDAAAGAAVAATVPPPITGSWGYAPENDPLELGTVNPGSWVAFAVRRTMTTGAARTDDEGFDFQAFGTVTEPS